MRKIRRIASGFVLLLSLSGHAVSPDSADGAGEHPDAIVHVVEPVDFSLAQNADKSPQKSPGGPDTGNPAKPRQNSTFAGSLTTRHIEAGGIGYDKGYTTAAGLMFYSPGQRHCTSWFTDLRVHEFNNNTQAANVGIGIRKGFQWIRRLLGGNIFYDYRNTRHHQYQQVGLGLELLGTGADIRMNGYIPFGQKTHELHRCTAYDRSKEFFVTRKRVEVAPAGVDLEVGAPYKKFRPVYFYGAVGAYYYTGRVCDKPFGGRVRLNMRFKDFFVEGIVSHDNVFETKVQGIIGYTFPFGKIAKSRSSNNCNYARKIAVQPVQRQEIIVLDKNCRWKWNF